MLERKRKVMDEADVCQTEDAIVALLEYLVDPKLPVESSAKDIPSQYDQESVAKQVQAAVLLYNYYHRKQHPELEFLTFEGFCKLAVIFRPAILAYMRLIRGSNDIELDDPEKQLSLTEKKIMDACDICMTLDASKSCPSIEGWPISKVAVLLVDTKKEKCMLQFGSSIHGVWSVIEKDVDISASNSKVSMNINHVDKKKRIIKKPLSEQFRADEVALQQLAFLTVKEATGINESELVLLESHSVYSLSKEKSAARFYIMQCTKSNDNHVIQIPIKNALDSLEGPLFRNSSYQWTHTSVVECFALLPYLGILMAWLSREGLASYLEVPREQFFATSTGSSEKTTNSHENATTVERLCRPGFSDQNDNNGHPASKGNSDLHSPKPSENSGCCMDGSPGSFDMLHDMDMVQANDSYLMDSKKEEQRMNTGNNSQKLATSMDRCLNGSTNGHEAKSEMAGLGMEWTASGSNVGNAANRSKNCNMSSGQGWLHSSDHALVTSGSNFKDLDKVCSIITSRGEELTKAALRVILRRRDKLSLQQRIIEDQIAECDKNIKIILNVCKNSGAEININIQRSSHAGDEDDLALKIESIIEGYSDVFPRNGAQENTNQHVEDQCSFQCLRSKRLPDAVLHVQDPCEELDIICYKNNWVLPTYHVSSVDGGFQANVTLKVASLGLSSEGNVCLHPRKARESAATLMLAKLCDMPEHGTVQ